MSASVGRRYEFLNDATKNRISYFAEKNETELVEHSRITFLEGLKYSYRNENDPQKKKDLHRQYVEEINRKHAPGVCGMKKKIALLLWKYIKY
jgi:hypothetical protein